VPVTLTPNGPVPAGVNYPADYVIFRYCPSPSVTIIPPPALHTSQSLATGTNHLIEIFAPPRLDFSRKPGWVFNADECQMPP
jgi:hypothetical protein